MIVVLILLFRSQSAWAQNIPASGADSELKGKIWTATANRIWVDIKPAKQKQPVAWATDEAFRKWRDTNPNDKSGLGLLWGAVAKKIRAEQKDRPATPVQVAQGILTELGEKRPRNNAWAKIDVAALRTDLGKIVPLTGAVPATAAPVAPAPKQEVVPAPAVTPVTPAATATAPAARQEEDADSALENSAAAQPAISKENAGSTSYIYQHPEQAMLGAGLLGVILGAIIMIVFRGKSSRSGRSHHSDAEKGSTNYAGQTAYLSEQELHWRNQNAELRKKIVELERKITAFETAAAPDTAPPSPAQVDPPLLVLPSPEEIAGLTPEAPEVPLEPVPDPVPAAPAPRYGPVQETAFIEERKIVDAPLPQLALMLTPDPHNPDRASFTLNPQVNQTMLIGDGLTRLQKFFDYDPPVGRITTVTAAEAGQLQRQADGWQVVERARLLVR